MRAQVAMAMAAAAVAAPAMAQNIGRASDRALAPLVACRSIAEVRARALCYDTALDRLQQSVSEHQVVVMDREQVSTERKSNFGLGPGNRVARINAPRAPRNRAAPPTDEITSVDATLTAASASGPDQWILRLSTGATWRTTEAGLALPRVGSEVHIRRGVMGGFLLKIGKGRAVHAVRIG